MQSAEKKKRGKIYSSSTGGDKVPRGQQKREEKEKTKFFANDRKFLGVEKKRKEKGKNKVPFTQAKIKGERTDTV